MAWAGMLFLLLPITHWATRPLLPGDVFWQVRTGQIALQTGVMPDKDPFSYTVPGAPWNNHEWLYELSVALLQRALGWGGVRLMVLTIAVATGLGLVVRVSRRAGPAAALLVLSLFCMLCRYKWMPVPQLTSMALFLGAFEVFRGRALACSRARLALMALTMLVWGNLTAECFLFLPFVLMDQFALRMAWRAQPSLAPRDALPLRAHVLLMALACVAPTLNPPWSSALEYALAGTRVNRAFNTEFNSLFAPATTVSPLAKYAAAALMLVYVTWAAAVWLRSGSRWDACRHVAPGLLAVLFAALFERNLWLMLLPAARLCAAAFDAAAAVSARRTSALAAAEIVVSAALFCALSLTLHWTPARAARELSSPDYRARHVAEGGLAPACLAPLDALQRPANVYALRLWSNYLIYRTPQVRVFVDGRNREYPDLVHQAAIRILEGAPDALALLDASRTEYVLVPGGWERSAPVRSGAFREVARASTCALYVRARHPAEKP